MGGLAFFNSMGTIGGFVGPALVGWLKQETGSFAAGLGDMAGYLFRSSILAIFLGLRGLTE